MFRAFAPLAALLACAGIPRARASAGAVQPLKVGKCAPGGLPSGAPEVTQLELATGPGAFPYETEVSMCWDEHALRLFWSARNDSQLLNSYRACNSETWNQEVVEVFVGAKNPGTGLLTKYLEVELTPYNILYVARITNPDGTGKNKTNKMISCLESGIQHVANAYNDTHAFSAV